MSINATDNGIKRELVPAGNYPARCYSMIHIGTVEEEFMGKHKILNKVRITWELPTEKRVFKEENGEQPMVISQEFTLSMYEKANLRKFLESWRGKGFSEEEAKSFDITKLLGVPCMLSIIHTVSKAGKERAEISAVAAMPKEMKCPDQINPSFEFNYQNKFDAALLETFPDFIKDKMKKSEEYKAMTMPSMTETKEPEPAEVNDLPF
jgi:hypothetical protein